MTVTAFASGTGNSGAALTVTTEHFVSDVNAAGVYTFEIDTNPLADGDVLELRVYKMILTSGTARPHLFAVYYGGQSADDLIKVSEPVSNELTDSQALRFSLKQTFGTGRSIVWKVLKHA